jgi:hypothetical protein
LRWPFPFTLIEKKAVQFLLNLTRYCSRFLLSLYFHFRKKATRFLSFYFSNQQSPLLLVSTNSHYSHQWKMMLCQGFEPEEKWDRDEEGAVVVLSWEVEKGKVLLG